MAFQEAFTIGVILSAKDLYSSVLHKAERDLNKLRRHAKETAEVFEKRFARVRRITEVSMGIAYTSAVIGDKLRTLTLSAAEFDQALHDVWTVVGGGKEVLPVLAKGIRDAQKEINYVYTGAELAEKALYELYSSGLKLEEGLAALVPTAKLSIATLADLRTMAKLTGRVLNTFGKEWDLTPFEKAQRIFSVLGTAVKEFQWTGDILSESLSWAVAAGKSFDLEFEEVIATLGMLNTRGIDASKAGTALTAFLREIVPAARKMGITVTDATGKLLPIPEILAKIHQKFGELDAAKADKLTRLLGDEGSRLVKVLWGEEKALKNYITELKSHSEAQKMFQKRLEGAQLQLLGVENRWQTLREEIALHGIPVLIWAKEKTLDLAEALLSIPGAKAFAGVIAGAGGAIAKITQMSSEVIALLNAWRMWKLQSTIRQLVINLETAAIEKENTALAKNIALWRTRGSTPALPPGTGKGLGKTGLLATWLPRLGTLAVPLAIVGGLILGAELESKRYEELKEKERKGTLTEEEKEELRRLELRRLEGSAKPKPLISPYTIPAYQTGGYVPKTGLALLHKGEWVLPHWEPRRPIQIHIDAPIHIHYSGSIGAAMDIERQVHRALEKALRRELRRAGIA